MTLQTSSRQTDRKQSLRRAAVLIVLCATLATVASFTPLHSALISVFASSEQLIQLHPVLGVVVFIAFAAVSAMLAFVSVAVIVPIAIYTWGEPLSMLLLWFGWILGGLCAYGIARLFSRTVVHWLTAEARIKQLESYVSAKTPFTLVLLLQLALPSEIPGYLLGLVRYPLARYLAVLSLAELPYAAATALLGDSFLKQRSYLLFGIGFLMVAFSLLTIQKLRSKLESD